MCTTMGSTTTTRNLFTGGAVALLAIYLYAMFIHNVSSPIVQTSQGPVKGYVARSRSGHEYYAYLGIPFAKPPVGPLRFEPPQPPESWSGVRDVTSYGSKCLQFDIMLRMTGGDEDCLFVNVFTRNVRTRQAPAAVMVYFYGGLFISGASNMYHPMYFMDEPDLVVVTFNYRVGALGFLNSGDGVVRGNMGLKDQVMALRWVQKNIHAFGGDARRVTIFGESAGAASVHYQMLSPLSKGLFQKAISQSGTALNHWALYGSPREQALRFATGHGCLNEGSTASSQEIVDCLRQVDAYALVDAHREVMRPLRDWITIFNPTVESVNDEQAFMAEQPIKLLREGRLGNDVPWITGVNSHEGLAAAAAIFRNDSMVIRIENEFDVAASNLFEVYPPNSSEIRALRQFYKLGTGNTQANVPIPDLDSAKFKAYTDIFSDRMFNAPLHHSATAPSQAQGLKAPMYLYYYTYRGEVTVTEIMLAARGRFPVVLEVATAFLSNWVKRNVLGLPPRKFDGPCHGDELTLLFSMFWGRPVRLGHPDYEFSKDLVKLWVDFAKGESEELHFRGTKWAPLTRSPSSSEDSKARTNSRLRYLQLDVTPKMIDEPFTERVQFWDKLGIDVQ